MAEASPRCEEPTSALEGTAGDSGAAWPACALHLEVFHLKIVPEAGL